MSKNKIVGFDTFVKQLNEQEEYAASQREQERAGQMSMADDSEFDVMNSTGRKENIEGASNDDLLDNNYVSQQDVDSFYLVWDVYIDTPTELTKSTVKKVTRDFMDKYKGGDRSKLILQIFDNYPRKDEFQALLASSNRSRQ